MTAGHARHYVSEVNPSSARCVAAAFACAAVVSASVGDVAPVPVAAPATTSFGLRGASAALSFPGGHDFALGAPTNGWCAYDALTVDIPWPAAAPTNAQVLLFLKDWDYHWYQTRPSDYLVPGATNRLRFDLATPSTLWTTIGHAAPWHFRARLEPKAFGLRLFSDADYTAKCELSNVVAEPTADTAPPHIRRVRVARDEVARFGKFEIACDLPDRYRNPFDADEVSLTATFVNPDGSTNTVDGFFTQGYFRQVSRTDEWLVPQGVPHWQVRYCPTQEGVYTYALRVQDRFGAATWGPASFRAAPSARRGFIRVSTADRRYFEFDDGTPFFIIGHNIRSPFDMRVVAEFPWTNRWHEGASAYDRYFADMAANGENLAEVWSAAWSLGLEWTDKWRGYHGLGQFNMMHAWDMDRVVERAESLGLYLNVVIHNHGKFSTFSEPEWEFNPFKKANGGFLDTPEEFFSDPRAIAAFQKLMRYMVARWGYSPHIFAWEMFSELDLTGSRRDGESNYKRPVVVEWHRLAGRYIKSIDPNRHLVSTHVCGDYKRQNTNIIALAEMDHCPVDAYHGSDNPLHIVTLMRETAEFNAPFRKPVQITEFGGSSRGQDIKHLEEALHAAVWASTAIPLAGTPMFWWWHLIEEENFYPMYRAVSRFVAGEDRRDSALKPYTPALYDGAYAATNLAVVALKGPARVTGWLYHATDFERVDPRGDAVTRGIVMKLQDMRGGDFEVEFWDTLAGEVRAREQVRADLGQLTIPVPPFARDVAFRVRPRETTPE